ncbi:LOW QUALITY PROTEIN: hypothetical protein ACHAWF_011301 [Thalassiosira exigua]
MPTKSGANTRLRSLSASGHPLPPESLRRLGRALSSQAEATPRDAGIVSLAVGSKDMGDEGAVALCEGLAETDGGALEVLDLGWKRLGSEGLRAVGKTFGPSERLKNLDLSRNEGVGDEGIASLAEAAGDRVGDDGAAFASLEALNLAECDVGAAGARSLADLISRRGSERTTKPLRLLAIGSNPLGAEGCEALAGLCAVPGGPSATSRLHMAGCSAGDGGIVALADAATANPCVGLEVLDASDNSITEAGAEALGRSLAESWPDLIELNLAKNELKSQGVASIVGALSSGRSDKSGEKKNSTLRSLDLSRTDCGAEGAAAALNAGCLASLRLFGNRLGSDGFRSVAPLLRGGHPTLETLDLGGNDAGEGSVAALLRSIADKRRSTVKAVRPGDRGERVRRRGDGSVGGAEAGVAEARCRARQARSIGLDTVLDDGIPYSWHVIRYDPPHTY